MAHPFAKPADIVRYIVESLGDRASDYLYGYVKGSLIITSIAQRPFEYTGRDKGLYDVTGEVFEILDLILADYYEPERDSRGYVDAAAALTSELTDRIEFRATTGHPSANGPGLSSEIRDEPHFTAKHSRPPKAPATTPTRYSYSLVNLRHSTGLAARMNQSQSRRGTTAARAAGDHGERQSGPQ